MKLYEWAIYAINIALVLSGIAFYKAWGIWIALIPWCAAAIVFLTYIYRVKVLPFNEGKRELDALAEELSMTKAMPHSNEANAIRHGLRTFSGFDGRIDAKDWYLVDMPAGTIMLGSYVLPGNLCYGFFLLVAFHSGVVSENVKVLKTSQRRVAMKARDEDHLAQLPIELQDIVDTTTLDIQIKKGLMLIDLEAREFTPGATAATLQTIIEQLFQIDEPGATGDQRV